MNFSVMITLLLFDWKTKCSSYAHSKGKSVPAMETASLQNECGRLHTKDIPSPTLTIKEPRVPVGSPF
uniref:Secreted protein n=1 Tax=Rhizophora mucronata TaxID=61149 RepID=A0A2P2P473_RHIMU